jgi:hypothetical protein
MVDDLFAVQNAKRNLKSVIKSANPPFSQRLPLRINGLQKIFPLSFTRQ